MAVRDGRPQVGIVMGSDSEWETMEAAAERLKHLEIDYEVQVMSAHRSPKLVLQYAEGARRRGLAVLIAGAGGAAHLAGVVAAHTTLPVIGVPVAAGGSSAATVSAMARSRTRTRIGFASSRPRTATRWSTAAAERASAPRP